MGDQQIIAKDIKAGGNLKNVNSWHNINIQAGGDVSVGEPADQARRRKELAQWMSKLDFSQQQSQIFAKHTTGTLGWIFKNPAFAAWLTNVEGGMIWAYGKPGAGKSTLASFIVDHLQQIGDEDETAVAAVCFIYCRYHTTLTVLQMFEALLQQLILRCSSVEVGNIQRLKTQGRRLSLDNEAAMGSISRFVVSAQDEDVKAHFWVQSKLHPTASKLIPKMCASDIEDMLVEKADGMFLLAGLHTTDLLTQTNMTQFLHALENLPKEATATYQHTIDRIRQQDPNKRRIAFQTLSWVLFSLRTLEMTELRYALATEGLDRMAAEDDLDDEDAIISSCAGLVVMNEKWGLYESSRTVSFIHYTVGEFLREACSSFPDFPSDVQIALSCIKVISFPGIRSHPPNYPLIQYAVSAWGSLVRRYERHPDVLKLALSQLQSLKIVAVLSAVHIDKLRSDSGHYTGGCGARAIHLIAAFGLLSTGRAFLRLYDDANSVHFLDLFSKKSRRTSLLCSKDSHGKTPLSWAAINGHWEVVKEVLGRCSASLNLKDICGRTPLSWATENEHWEVVTLLLTHRAIDVNSRDEDGHTRLSRAALLGHSEIVKSLLSHPKVKVNTKDRRTLNSLSLAAEKGHSGIVKQILTHHAVNVNCRDEDGHTPLSQAAVRGKIEIIKLLLDHPMVNVNSEDRHGRTPLSWASANQHRPVIELLLAHPAVDVNSRGEDGHTSLSRAALLGDLETVRLLLSHPKVNINSKDHQTAHPLTYAAENGHSEVVKQLLTCRAINVNLRDAGGHTPLSQASSHGHSETVKLLLRHSNEVDVDSEGNDRRTALSWAAKNQHLEVVELLLPYTVNVNSRDADGLTALSRAAMHGHSKAVKLLLRHSNKVDVNSKDDDQQTALSWAAKNQRWKVVKLLLPHNDDVNSRDKDGHTALSRASMHGHSETVKLLLNTPKVNADSKDEDGQSPLSWAAGKGHLAVVKQLLAHPGVDVNSRGWLNTALSRAAGNGHLDVVQELLTVCNVDVNLGDDLCRTPLLRAEQNGHSGIVQLLRAYTETNSIST